jgi:hypothetical protein
MISPEIPLEEKQEAIREVEASLSEVTKHCDMEVPIQATTVRISTIVLNKLRWLAHHPRRGVQAKEDQLKYAIDLIEVEANTRLNKVRLPHDNSSTRIVGCEEASPITGPADHFKNMKVFKCYLSASWASYDTRSRFPRHALPLAV